MVNKAQQIRGYKQANPTHKPSDIAKACGVTTTYVYQVLHNAKKKKSSTADTRIGRSSMTKVEYVLRAIFM